jgi:multidrug efflux system outer membrane protein
VQRQARAVEAAAARLGVAKRDLYPRIQLDWAGRKERVSIEGASASPITVVGYGIGVSLPIFDGGRIRANIAVHEARAQEAMAEYEKAMLGALADAEIALAQLATADASVTELEEALRAGADAARRSQRMFEAGLVGLDTVLDVRRSHLRAHDALLQARGAQWVAAVAVRRAFAGKV